jgi:transposase-like protein
MWQLSLVMGTVQSTMSLASRRRRVAERQVRRATRARGHLPNEQAARKSLDKVVRSLDPTGRGQERWMNRWKPALNAFWPARITRKGHAKSLTAVAKSPPRL